MNENAKNDFDNRVDVLNDFKKLIDNLNSASNENQISINAVVSNSFVKKYSILKFPQFFFFRKGNFVQYKGLYANIAF